mgnify:CR=1 FL=1
MRALSVLSVVSFSAALSVATAAAHGFGSGSFVSVGVVAYAGAYSLLRVDDGIGPGDAVTYVRIGLVAYVAGFVATRPGDTVAYLATGAFVSAAFLDAFDGAVARRTRTTGLGDHLDGEADGLSTAVGVVVGVAHGWLPLAYIAVGAARYAFVLGVVVRRRLGMTVAELDDSTVRKLLSSAQLFVIACALVPFVPAGVVRPAAYSAMVPFLIWFLRDWSFVCRNPE